MISPSLQQLATTLLWSSNDESTDEPLDSDYGICDIDPESLKELSQRFQAFVEKAEAEVARIAGSNCDPEDFYTGSGISGFNLEHDYIMTVNGHGCGFWERSLWQPDVGEILTKLAREGKEIHCYIQDEKVFIEFG